MRIQLETNLRIPMRDGVDLAADLYLPETDGPVPALVERTPYDRQRAQARNFALEVRRAAEAGFAVLVQDTRGRYASGGDFRPFFNESQDGADTLAWVAQQPWCSGRIGMFGGSYGGLAQWATATEAGAPLGAIVPFMTAADVGSHWAYRGGALQLGFLLTWTITTLIAGEAIRQQRQGRQGPSPAEVTAAVDGIGRSFEYAPLCDVSLPGKPPYYREWLAHPPGDTYWHQAGHLPDAPPPALVIAGWHDIFLAGALRDYTIVRRQVPRRGSLPRLVVGPWAHRVTEGSFPERGYGRSAGMEVSNIGGLQIAWLSSVLDPASRLDPKLPLAPVRLFVMGANEWREYSDWPPADSRPRSLYLESDGHANTADGDGRLLWSEPAAEGEDSYLYDPMNPAPTIGGGTFLPGLEVGANSGPRNTAVGARRPDVLCYTSEPLAETVEVVGPIELVLFVRSSAEDTDLTGRLVDVAPDGRAEHVTDGILRLRYRESIRAPRLMQPGRQYEIRIDLGGTATRFPAGHRLRVEVSSSNFPRFDRNTNSGGDIAYEGVERWRTARNSVLHGPSRPSRLVVSVLPTNAEEAQG
jgi:putative CocE/NonD family hydrolase